MPAATRSATTVEMVLRDSPVRRASSARDTAPLRRRACSTSARLRSRSASSEPGAAVSSRIAGPGYMNELRMNRFTAMMDIAGALTNSRRGVMIPSPVLCTTNIDGPITVRTPRSGREVVVVILAGGQGERLSILSAHRAKPAVPYGGKYRIIDFALSNCVNSGLFDILVLDAVPAGLAARPHRHRQAVGPRPPVRGRRADDLAVPRPPWRRLVPGHRRRRLPEHLRAPRAASPSTP